VRLEREWESTVRVEKVGISVRHHVSGKCYIENRSAKWSLGFVLWATKLY
jgi:hypothetical protein